MSMTAEARNARAEYYRQWRKRNPDKVRATNERYWQKKCAEWKAEEEAKAGESAETSGR